MSIESHQELTPDDDTLKVISCGKLTLDGKLWVLSDESRCVFNGRLKNDGQLGLWLIVTGLTETQSIIIDLLHIIYSK
jgi:hypothetical protein